MGKCRVGWPQAHRETPWGRCRMKKLRLEEDVMDCSPEPLFVHLPQTSQALKVHINIITLIILLSFPEEAGDKTQGAKTIIARGLIMASSLLVLYIDSALGEMCWFMQFPTFKGEDQTGWIRSNHSLGQITTLSCWAKLCKRLSVFPSLFLRLTSPWVLWPFLWVKGSSWPCGYWRRSQ